MSTLAPIHTQKLNVEQFFQLGGDPSGARLELIDGDIIVSPSPSRSHADVVFALAYLLETHLRSRRLGRIYLDTDVVFSPAIVRRPDICFFRAAQLKRLKSDRLDQVPDLCIEVLSPFNVDDDRINKFKLYQAHHVGHYWIIDPEERKAECFALQGGKYKKVSSSSGAAVVRFPPFADLAIALADLWTPGH
jgi:Uma2 family endonuclease